MIDLINKTNIAICLTILSEQNERDLILKGASCPTERYVIHQVQSLPSYLRLPFLVLTLIFSFSALIHYGLFHQLPVESRITIVNSWRNSALGIKKDFIRFYDMLIRFSLSEWLSK